MEGQQNESIFQMLKFSTLPIAKVFVMCLLGYILASKRVNLLTPSGRKLLNGLVFTLFLPCIIFTQLGRAVTLQKMMEWWFIPMNIVCGTILASLIGFVVALLVRPPKDYFKFTIVQIGIGNIGNVPLVLIGAMCRDKNNPFGDSQTCDETGSAYISFGQWVGAVIIYTYVFYMLSPPENAVDSVANGFKPNTEVTNTISVPLLADEEGIVDYTPKPMDWRSRAMEVMAEVSSFLERMKIKQIFQPPVVASILALLIGITPFLKHLILSDDAPLFFITDSCIILGGAMIPCIMLALGGNLIGGKPGMSFYYIKGNSQIGVSIFLLQKPDFGLFYVKNRLRLLNLTIIVHCIHKHARSAWQLLGPSDSKLGLRTTVAIIFARLILVPPVGLGIVTLADNLGFLPANDKMFRFILLLQHTMPTSILAGAVANIRGFAEKEASAILFWVHIFAMFSMTMWITLYLNILF